MFFERLARRYFFLCKYFFVGVFFFVGDFLHDCFLVGFLVLFLQPFAAEFVRRGFFFNNPFISFSSFAFAVFAFAAFALVVWKRIIYCIYANKVLS